MRPTDPGPDPGPPPDRLFALSLALVVVGLPTAYLGWIARPAAGFPWAAAAGLLAVALGIPLFWLRVKELDAGSLVRQVELDQVPTSSWERRHPDAAPAGVALLAAATLAFIAIRRGRPPFARPDPEEGWAGAFIEPSGLAAILWALVGGIAAHLAAGAARRRRLVGSPAGTVAVVFAVLASAAGAAFGYFAVLGLGAPRLPDSWWKGILVVAAAALCDRGSAWWRGRSAKGGG